MVDGFPKTRLSAVVGSASPDATTRARSFDVLAACYFAPAVAYVRRRWNASQVEAEDWVQDFFARALGSDVLGRYDAGRARFRTYLRACLDSHVQDARRAASRHKRGGGAPHVDLDAAGDITTACDLDALLHAEWVQSVFAHAVESLRRRCEASGKRTHFALFERYDLEGPAAAQQPTYADLARQFDLPVTQVTNHLAAMRRAFRRELLATLRATTASDAEFRAEARALLGGEP
jgi:DNA-directed RNA polymerase specialized sigma24 family protein